MHIRVLLSFLVISCCVSAQFDTTALSAKLSQSKNNIGKDFVFMLYKDGKVAYKKEMGKLNMKSQEEIGASSQWLTTALVMTYVQEGKISLDDKVSQYLPIFEKYYKGYVTIRHCLTHYTGIQSDQKLFQKSKYKKLEDEVNDYASKKDIQTNAGEEFRYSNIGFNIAGRVLEVVTRRAFDRLMLERIIRPLGMKNTTFTNEDYDAAINPATGARSTAVDYTNFLAMLLNKGSFNGKQILTDKSIADMHALQASPQQIKFPPKLTEGLSYGVGEWILETNAKGEATAFSNPSFTGIWPIVDVCRGYSCILFSKEASDSKQFYVDLKATIDDGMKGGCN